MVAKDGTGPGETGKAVASNTKSETEQAPPTVSGSPSSDTSGAAGTSTAAGPGSLPEGVHLPEGDDGLAHHGKRQGNAEVPPPGNRPDDAHDGPDDKTTTRQE